MATIERHGQGFRVAFWFAGQRFRRSLKTQSVKEANGTLARLEDNLRRFELGLLDLPEGADLASFLLSDGRTTAKPTLPTVRTLHELFETFFASLPTGSIEQSTVDGMRIHQAHLERILGKRFPIQTLEAGHLQTYIVTRSGDAGTHGRRVSVATIAKDLRTLRTIWNYAKHMGLFARPFPNHGLRFPKVEEKPPFRTLAEIETRVKRDGLSPAEVADLWDSAFLTLADIEALLQHVQQAAHQPFIYPMFVVAAHTGARRSELLRSLWDDIEFDTASLMIRERKRVRGKLSTRHVPLSPLLDRVLRQWQKEHPGGPHTFSQRLEVSRSKTKRTGLGPVTRDEAHDHFKRTLAGSRFENLRGWHCLRHSFASNCAAKGIDQRVINAWMGHQTEDMVKRYRHLLPNQLFGVN